MPATIARAHRASGPLRGHLAHLLGNGEHQEIVPFGPEQVNVLPAPAHQEGISQSQRDINEVMLEGFPQALNAQDRKSVMLSKMYLTKGSADEPGAGRQEDLH